MPPIYDSCYAMFYYVPPIDYLITACKFRHKLNYTKLLGLLLAKFLTARLTDLPELIIPVPLHKQRLAERGYNQALEIARPISHALHIPLDYSCCRRTRATQAQTELTLQARHKNVKNAFAIQREITAKRIAIVDDVMTTGSTVAELAKALKCYGVQHIQVWCCARTTHPRYA
jgi:ComF family protein